VTWRRPSEWADRLDPAYPELSTGEEGSLASVTGPER
jgi:hypothetical protein